MNDIYDFSKTVRSICFSDYSAYWRSFAATTLPFPPQLAALYEEDRKLQHNYLDTLVNIKTRIVEYFKVIFRMKEDSYRRKNEALAHRST